MTCKCIKCNRVNSYDSFKTAWMKGWDFLKEIKNKERDIDILGVCEQCPTLTSEEEFEIRQNVA